MSLDAWNVDIIPDGFVNVENNVCTTKIQKEQNSNVIRINGTINDKLYSEFTNHYGSFSIDEPLVIELTTKGGDLTYGYMISRVLQNHNGCVTVRVPYYALSIGTIIALSADKIVLSHAGFLGPINPYVAGLDVSVKQVHKGLKKYNSSWLNFFSSRLVRLLTGYGESALKSVKNTYNYAVMSLLNKYDNGDDIFRFFASSHHYKMPIYYTDIPPGLELPITMEPDLLRNTKDNLSISDNVSLDVTPPSPQGLSAEPKLLGVTPPSSISSFHSDQQ